LIVAVFDGVTQVFDELFDCVDDILFAWLIV
jgi:hypothetical protein